MARRNGEWMARRSWGWLVVGCLVAAPAWAESEPQGEVSRAAGEPGAAADGDRPAAEAAAAEAEPAAASGEPTGEPTPAPEPALASEPTPEPAAEPPSPEPPSPQQEQTDRVRFKLDVAGEIFAPAGRDAPPVRRPIVVDARFDFLETMRTTESGITARRCYRDAAAEVRVDGESRATRLADDARDISVVLRGTTPAPHLEGGFLSREELDLLETPFDPLLLDRLLPGRSVAVAESWPVAADAAAGLLAIDTIESGGLEATLETVENGQATVKVTGIVDGGADGVPTHVTVEGTVTVTASGDSAAVMLKGPVVRAEVALRERREASHVSPGFDVEARLTVVRTPHVDAGRHAAESASGTTTAARVGAGVGTGSRRQGTGRPGLVWHRDAASRYDLVYDDRWRVIEDGVEGLLMRFVDRGALVAQCSVTALPRAASQSPPSIAEVERDIEKSLAGQFGRIEHSSEAARSDGVRIVRVAVAGRAGDLPFRWIHHVLTDAAGHRLAVTCMLEQALEKRFGAADRELIDGISLPGNGADSAAETVGAPMGPPDREARVPAESRTP
jgi:hypothetical protein